MPTFRQRLAFLRRADRSYLRYLLLRKLGKRRVVMQREGRRLVVPLRIAGGVQLAYMSTRLPIRLLRRLLPLVPGTFIDVGANVGNMLVALRLVDDERPWIGFEPSLTACAYIRELIEANGFRNTTLVEAGLSDRPGSTTLYASSGTDSSASMIRDFPGELAEVQDKQYEVRVLKGADLLGDELSAKSGVVKIDVEGMELEVVRGLRPLLQRDRPVLLIEILPVREDGTERARRLRMRQNDLNTELSDLDYRLALVREDGVRDVEAPLNDESLGVCDYLAIPIERADEIRPRL